VRVLVLGGTLFLGRHLVETALARSHDVTIFTRGRTNPGLYPDVERLRGDRDGDLSALEGRRWDAVVDTSAELPRWVRAAARLLVDRVEHYTFVSTCSVYADVSRAGVDETAPVHGLADETIEEIHDAATYGARNALCEREAERAFPGRALVVRPGLIVGPYDDSGRFTYWVHRIARGGDVLAPEPRGQRVQFIDARDLAEWVVDRVEARAIGVYNATGPVEPITMGQLLEAIVTATGSDARFVWVDEEFLMRSGVEAWTDLPLWLAPNTYPELAGFLSIDIGRAVAAGLRFRPLAETIRATLEQAAPTPAAGLSREREAALLRAWQTSKVA
jgi:2'-hydroxyisoflavone reductase